MSRDRQIEGIQKDLIKIAEQPVMIEGLEHWSDAIAEALYNAGYRKSKDVAREIFEEIERKVKASITIHLEEINKEHIKDTPLYDRCSGIVFALRNAEDFLAELKKKYIGKDTNVTTNTEEGK